MRRSGSGTHGTVSIWLISHVFLFDSCCYKCLSSFPLSQFGHTKQEIGHLRCRVCFWVRRVLSVDVGWGMSLAVVLRLDDFGEFFSLHCYYPRLSHHLPLSWKAARVPRLTFPLSLLPSTVTSDFLKCN